MLSATGKTGGAARFCMQKVADAKATSAEAAVRSKGELKHLQKDYDWSRLRTAAAKSSFSNLHKESGLVAAKAGNLKFQNASLQMELSVLFLTHVEVEDMAR